MMADSDLHLSYIYLNRMWHTVVEDGEMAWARVVALLVAGCTQGAVYWS